MFLTFYALNVVRFEIRGKVALTLEAEADENVIFNFFFLLVHSCDTPGHHLTTRQSHYDLRHNRGISPLWTLVLNI